MTTTNGMTDNTPNPNGTPPNGAVPAKQDPNTGLVRAADIVGEMQTAYLDYAMSVIVARALPDVRDGLKPVHRRILYAMYHDLNMTHDKPHKKSARIVGEVLGKYHPHGDVAVYDAMVRMAQEFSLRYPLIDGQGNFGSIDGDNAAAMRYTEARMAEITGLMVEDLDRDTVGWHPNFDNTLREPDILPAALPNLLINGASGIAVGMATNVPPHNLGEIVDALVHLIDNYQGIEEITVEQMMTFVKGPDFPTGGILYRYREDVKGDESTDAIAQGYAVGKSRLVLQAKAHFEEMSRGRMRIVVTELPYQTNKTALIERIAALSRDGKLDGLTDLRDESDRTGMRIVMELTRNADPKTMLADLFKYTPLQQTFGMQILALVDGQPKLLSLKRALHLFLQHREEIVRRRSEFELAKAKARAHIVEGLLKALDILDEVIDTIRRSQNVDTARANLIKNFAFSEVQAQAILDMQLRRLAALERRKLKEEFDDLLKRIKYLEGLLADPTKILKVIREELLAQREKYSDARRTQIVDRTKGTLTTTDLLPQQDVWVAVNSNGDLIRHDVVDNPSTTTVRQLGKIGQIALLTANTRDWLYLFTRDGRCARISVHEIPQDGNPKHLSELCGFTRRDSITAAITLPRENASQANDYLLCVTAQGMVKRVTLSDFLVPVSPEFTVINVDEKDNLGWVLPTRGDAEIILVTATGQSIRFGEEDVRSMGLSAAGIGGMKLAKKDSVVYAALVDPAGTLLTMTTQGYAKQTVLTDYSRQGRNGSGIATHKPTSRTGDVTTALVLPAGLDAMTALLVTSQKSVVKSLTLEEIPVMGRAVQGKQVVETNQGDRIVAIKRLLDKGTPPPAPAPDSRAPTPQATQTTPSISAPKRVAAAPPGSKTNGKQDEAPTVQPHVTAQPAPVNPPAAATKRNFVAAQAAAPAETQREPKVRTLDAQVATTPIAQSTQTVVNTAPDKKANRQGQGSTPTPAGPVKLIAPRATAPVPADVSKDAKAKGKTTTTVVTPKIDAEKSARQTTVALPAKQPTRSADQAQVPLLLEQAPGPEKISKPRKGTPTIASPVKLTAQRAAPLANPKADEDKDGKGKLVAAKSSPAKATKEKTDAQAQPQNLELFPVDTTDAPKSKSGKLEIAVSVNRQKKKKSQS